MSAYWDPIKDTSSRTEHAVTIEPDTFFTKGDGFRAACSCGWKGPGCMYEQDAEAGVRAHLRDIGVL